MIEKQYQFEIDREKNFYGLLDPITNRFYMLDNDYEVIKWVQMLLMNQKLLMCVPLRTMASTAKNMNNENCYQYGCTADLIRNVRFDVDMVQKDISKIVPSTTPSHINENLRTNVFFLRDFLRFYKMLSSTYEEMEMEKFGDSINGLAEFRKFVKIMIPNDPNIDELVEYESDVKKKAINKTQHFTSVLFDILFKKDYIYQTLPEIKNSLREELNDMKFDYRFFKTFTTTCVARLR